MIGWLRDRLIGIHRRKPKDQALIANAVIPAAKDIARANLEIALRNLDDTAGKPLRHQRAQLTAILMSVQAAHAALDTAIHQVNRACGEECE